MFKKMKIRTKILSSFTLLIAFTVTVGFLGTRGINQIIHMNGTNYLTNQSLSYSQEAQAATLRYIIYQDESYIQKAEDAIIKGVAKAETAYDRMVFRQDQQLLTQLINNMEEYESLNQESYRIQMQRNESDRIRSDAARKLQQTIHQIIGLTEDRLSSDSLSGGEYRDQVRGLQKLQKILNVTYEYHINAEKYKQAVKKEEKAAYLESWTTGIIQSRNLLLDYEKNINAEEFHIYIETCLNQIDIYQETISEFVDLENSQTEIYADQQSHALEVMKEGDQIRASIEEVINQRAKLNIAIAVLFSIVAILFSIGITFLITSSLSRQLGGEPYEIEAIASSIAKGDLTLTFPEKKLTGIYGSMETMTSRLKSIVIAITESAKELTNGSDQIAESASEISSGASEQAANMEEISASIEELNSNIQQNSDNAAHSNTMSQEVTENAKEASDSVTETLNAMRIIDEKTAIVEELARNTNLLALNAAIEAARAGEAGKGFAVVASEVRKLAESSAIAAKEITEITKSSVHQAEQAQKRIEKVLPLMKKTAELVEEISYASKEQTIGSSQINDSVVQLDTVIQQNASASEELASMSEEMSAQAHTMIEAVSYFQTDDSQKRDLNDKTLKKTSPEKKHRKLLLASSIASIDRRTSGGSVNDSDFIEF